MFTRNQLPTQMKTVPCPPTKRRYARRYGLNLCMSIPDSDHTLPDTPAPTDTQEESIRYRLLRITIHNKTVRPKTVAFFNCFGHKLRWTVNKPNFTFLMRQLHFMYEGDKNAKGCFTCYVAILDVLHTHATLVEETGFIDTEPPESLQRIRCRLYSRREHQVISVTAEKSGLQLLICPPATRHFILFHSTSS